MKIIIQSLIILLAIFIAAISLSERRTYYGKAWKKVALILLAISMIITVLLPEIINNIANYVGVGRGADLLLYGTVASFILYVLNNYLHQQDQQDKIHRLARKVAILDANERYKDLIIKQNLDNRINNKD